MNTQQLALIKKDIRSITSNKQVLIVMLMVPLALTIVLPSILVFVTVLVPESASDFQKLLDMLPVSAGEHDQKQVILWLMLNRIMPAFFLMIPVMASSVMAASSFVGEKENGAMKESARSIQRALPGSNIQILPGMYHGEFSINHADDYVNTVKKIIANRSC